MALRRTTGRGVVVLAAALGLGAGAWALRPPVRGAPAAPPYVTYILVDGMSQEVFQQELAAGRLPNFARLVREGLWVRDGVAAFPSMTAYGFWPLITGQDAVDSGVLGLRWFRRGAPAGAFRAYVGRTSAQMNADFRADVPTVFELAGEAHTHSVNSYANRGVKHAQLLGWSFSMAKYRDTEAWARALARVPGVGPRLLPDWYRAEERALEAALAELPHAPKVQWITFAAPDGAHHVSGGGATYVALVRHVDALLGRYRAESARLGQEGQRLYVLASDHGMVDVGRNADLRAPLERAGLRAWRGAATHLSSSELTDPLSTWADTDALVVINGNTLNYLYLRAPGDAWTRRAAPGAARAYAPRGGAPVDLVPLLLAEPAVETVVLTGADGSVEVHAAGGRARIRDAGGGRLAYSLEEGQDPLGLPAELADGTPRTDAEWLAASHAGPYPDGVVRLWRLLRAPDAGDVVVLARPGWDLASDYEVMVGNYRGGHGGLRADQLRVPYVLSGPGVPRGVERATARAEDVGATVLKLLGLPLPPDAGRPLL